MIKAFECIHCTGYVFNNLKIENVMIGRSSSSLVKLIDYSKAQRFLDEDGNHLEQTSVDNFEGFSLYASLNAL
jgi:serine/threonine protein kinase